MVIHKPAFGLAQSDTALPNAKLHLLWPDLEFNNWGEAESSCVFDYRKHKRSPCRFSRQHSVLLQAKLVLGFKNPRVACLGSRIDKCHLAWMRSICCCIPVWLCKRRDIQDTQPQSFFDTTWKNVLGCCKWEKVLAPWDTCEFTSTNTYVRR